MIQIIFVLTKLDLDAVILLHESDPNQIQELQEQVEQLKAENYNLKTIIRELQWRVDPYSSDGDAICNSKW